MLEKQLMLAEASEHQASDTPVLLKGLGEDEDIVKVDDHNPLHDEIMKDVIHHRLKGGRAVGEAKEHNERLKKTPVGPKGCLPLVPFLDPDVVIPPTNIKLGEVPGPSQTVDDVGDEGKGIAVLDGDLV